LVYSYQSKKNHTMNYMIELTEREGFTFNSLSYNMHKHILNDLMSEGAVLFYAESNEQNKFWITVEAEDIEDAVEIISDLPIVKSLKVNVTPLFTNFNYLVSTPSYCLN